MSTITKILALAAFAGVLGTSGFAFAKTQVSAHEHAVERSQGQQSNHMQGTDIPKWSRNKTSNGSSGGEY